MTVVTLLSKRLGGAHSGGESIEFNVKIVGLLGQFRCCIEHLVSLDFRSRRRLLDADYGIYHIDSA
jgi:hypothetical protein